MTAGSVPTTNVQAFYNNTTSQTPADPNKIDAAIQDIVQTVNDNYAVLAGFYQSDKVTNLGIINVKDYEAKGDGVNDDAAAIQTALTAAATANAVAYFPPGTYLVSSGLTASCSIEFADPQTVIKPKAGTTISPILTLNSPVLRFYKNISIAPSSRDSVTQDGILITSQANRIYMENIRLVDLNGYGLYVDTVYDSVFNNIHIESCGNVANTKSGLKIYSSIGDTSNQNTFIGIQTEKCYYYGLDVEDTAYSNRFIGIHAEWNVATTGNFIRLGGYRNQYYGSGHLGSNYEKVYVGGENNVYNGIFFDNATVEDTGSNSGKNHYLTNCVVNTYNQFGGSTANFLNCDIGTLTINGNNVKVFGGTITTLTHTFTGGSSINQFSNVRISTLTQGGSGAANLELYECIVQNNVTFQGNGIKVSGGEFQGTTTISFMGGTKELKDVTFDGVLTVSGNASQYGCKFYHCVSKANVSLDSSNASEFHLCTISGDATGDSTSKLIKSYVSGTVTGITIV